MAKSSVWITLKGEKTKPSPFNILKAYFTKLIFEQRLDNWLGISYSILGGLFCALLIAKKGMLIGSLFFLVIIGMPFLFAAVINPFFGVCLIITISYFLLGIKRATPGIPLGLFTDAMIVLLLLSIMYRNLEKREVDFLRGPITLMIIVYMIYVFGTYLNPIASCKLCYVYSIRSMAGYMFMYVIVIYAIKTKKQIHQLIVLWLFLSLIAALYALKQEYIGLFSFESSWIWSDPKRYGLYYQWGHLRKFSFLSDPTSFGINMGYSIILATVLLFSKISKKKKFLLFVLVFIMIQAMLVSGTRTAYIMLPLGAMLFLILIKNKKIYLYSIAGVICLLILIFVPTKNSTLKRFQSAFAPTKDPSYVVRIENQRLIRPHVLSHPFGSGLGVTGTWGNRFGADSFLAGFPTDSGYVRIAIELGWVGLTLYFILWFVIFKQGIDSYFRIRDPDLKYIVLAMVCVLFSLYIVTYAQQALVQLPTSLIFWVATAIISRGGQLGRSVQIQDK